MLLHDNNKPLYYNKNRLYYNNNFLHHNKKILCIKYTTIYYNSIILGIEHSIIAIK